MQNVYCLVQCEEQRLERESVREGGGKRGRERERESCCAVKLLLDMWRVPTLFQNP